MVALIGDFLSLLLDHYVTFGVGAVLGCFCGYGYAYIFQGWR